MRALWHMLHQVLARLRASAAHGGQQSCRQCGVCHHVCTLLPRQPHNDAKALEE